MRDFGVHLGTYGGLLPHQQLSCDWLLTASQDADPPVPRPLVRRWLFKHGNSNMIFSDCMPNQSSPINSPAQLTWNRSRGTSIMARGSVFSVLFFFVFYVRDSRRSPSNRVLGSIYCMWQCLSRT